MISLLQLSPMQQQNMCSLYQLLYLLPELFIAAVAGAAAEHVLALSAVITHNCYLISLLQLSPVQQQNMCSMIAELSSTHSVWFRQ